MADTHNSTVHDEDLGQEVPVVVGYEITGLFEVCITSVRSTLLGLGPEILHTLDASTVESLEQEICRLIPWRDAKGTDHPNYAPPRELA